MSSMYLGELQGASKKQLEFREFKQLYKAHIESIFKKKHHCNAWESSYLQEVAFRKLHLGFPNGKQFPAIKFLRAIYSIMEEEIALLNKDADKNFGLSEVTFNAMLEQLQHGNKHLFEKAFLEHFSFCQQYLQKRYKASAVDAYDATMNALLEFCKRLQKGQIRYGNLRFLFTQMASQIYLKWIKKQSKKTSMDLSILELPDAPPATYDEETLTILNKAWEKLGAGCQQLLKRFYYDNTNLRQIAEDMGKSDVALRKQKQRCMDHLRHFFKKFYQ